MKKFAVFAFIVAVSTLFSKAQDYPRDYFLSPLDPPIIITGTFGEIRNDHFHSGIDISTEEQEGVPVMAAADGYVSRIKIASDGYGKAIYVTHPNGFVTVYGHMEKFTAPINAYIRKIQYEKRVFEVDVNLTNKDFIVKQKEVIGYSGSTGSAESPHLHFEIRDGKSEEPINPLLFGIMVRDTMPPVIKRIRIFPVREAGIVNNTDSAFTYDLRYDSTLGKMVLNTYDFPIVYGTIGFGFEAFDRMDTNNVLGVYSEELYVDTVLIFSTKFDRFNFNNTRDVNAHIDYLSKKRDNMVIERCHKLPGDRLSFYGGNSADGFSTFSEDMSHDIRIVVKDFSGNKADFTFQAISYVSLSETPYMPKDQEAVLVTDQKGAGIHKSKLDVVIPEGAAYESFYYDDESFKGSGFMSDIFRVGDAYEPLKMPVTLGLKPSDNIKDSLLSKAIIVQVNSTDENVSLKSIGGKWEGKLLTTKSYEFGNYAIVLDTIPPSVSKYYVPADMNSMYGGVVKIIIKDELSGIKSYSGKIDDEWFIFEYDKKSDMITANVDSKATNLEHTIEVTVTDKCDNTYTWKSSFYF
jgi:hypothetical protein